MTKHAYLPTTLISDKGTAFTSNVFKEVAGVLGITLKHATTKHAQTIGLLEWSHASIKQALKIETGERRSLWHKYVSIAVLNYNTSYHARIGCEPSRVFHGRIPYNILDLKMGIRPQEIPLQTRRSPKMCLNRQKQFSRTSPKIPCEPISNTKRIMMGKQMPQNWKKPITSSYYSRKQTTKGVKFPSQTFAGLDHTFLKRCYPTITIWYAKSALTRRKSFIEWGCNNSHPANRYQTYQPHNASGNQTRKLSSHTMTYTPGHGNVNMTSQYLTAITIIWQHPVHPRLQ